MVRRVLYIAYAFPPTGGAGVQRTTKFVKYLPHFGWQPSVLTVTNPSVPLKDVSLGQDIPASTVVRRAMTLEPSYALKAAVSAGSEGSLGGVGYARAALKRLSRRILTGLLQPDAQILWMPSAVTAGRRLLSELAHSAIVATGPPFSSFLIGMLLSRRSRLPLVLDYRDEWDLSTANWENKRQGRLSRSIQERMQRQAVRSARALVATTRSSAETLEHVRARAASKARVTWIYNGFDPDDFSGPCPEGAADKGTYRLAYIGTLWNLTSVEPLVEAVFDLARRQPSLTAKLELIFVGRRTPAQQLLLDRLKASPCRLVQHPYLDHHAALNLLRSADALCVLLSSVPGAERVVPAKIFEYAATKRPILVIAPRGEVWDLLKEYPCGHFFVPGDTEGISACLASEIERHQESRHCNLTNWDPSPFDRRHQARQLADLLDELT